MLSRVALLLTVLLTACGCVKKSAQAVANGEIYDTFRRFRAAVAAHDGPAAVNELSSSTFEDYRRLRDAALSTSAEDLRRLPLELRLEVLRLRCRMNAEELAALDGRSLAQTFVSRGWLNTDLITRIRLANVIHKPGAAEVRFGNADGLTTQRLVFRQESDGWKFDLSAGRWMQRKALRQVLQTRGLTESQLLDLILQVEAGERNPEELWAPLSSASGLPVTAG